MAVLKPAHIGMLRKENAERAKASLRTAKVRRSLAQGQYDRVSKPVTLSIPPWEKQKKEH